MFNGEEDKITYYELAPSLQKLFNDGLEKHLSKSNKNLDDEIEREKKAISKVKQDILDAIDKFKSDQFGVGGVKGRVLKFDINSLYADDHFFNMDLSQGNKPEWLYKYNFVTGKCYDHTGKQIDIPQNEINKAMTNLIEEFEKESGKISNDGNYSIEKLYNMKQGFEKVSENNRKEIKRVLKAEERKMQNISEELDIVKKFTIDILILMDITGSMGSYLSEAKTFLKNLVKDLISSFIGLTVRLSFIGYRDFDRNLKEEEYVNIDFTENHEFITKSISDCQATGGGDTCEDVAGALERGLNKNWNSKARYAILVCDAPAHGKKYYNNQDDSFPQGDPKGRNIEKFIDEFHNLNVNFFCVEISSITNIMFNCFRNIYKNQNIAKGKELIFEVQKLNNSSELKNYIFQTSRKVYEKSKS
jgi:hypothetical protein